MKGGLFNLDWSVLSTLFDTTSPIPGDIEFKVVDAQDQVVDSLPAHKVILAVHSVYFRAAFFGTGTFFKEDGAVLIKETTKEAFRDLVGFIYEKEIDFGKKTLMELFEILNVAQRYQVDELKEMVSGHINNFPISLENVVMVAATAQELSHFDEVSKHLLKRCLDLLSTKMVDVRSVLAFISNNEDAATVQKLLKDLDVKTKSTPKEKNIALALFDFSGRRTSQMSFRKEDLLLVEASCKKWLYAEKGEETGWVPHNYVLILDRVLSEKQAKEDYHVEEANSLSFSKGDLVQIYKEVLGWAVGKAGNRIGYFPLKYVAASG